MKTVLIELLAFSLICVFGTAAGGFFIMIFQSVTSFVAGSELNIFSAQLFVKGVIAFFPILLLFTPMFLLLTLVRHPKYNKVFGAISIAIFSLAAWIFLAPVAYKAASEQSLSFDGKPSQLTPGYFRTINDRLYYFTFVSGNYVSGIRFDGDHFSSSNSEKAIHILDSNYINFKRGELGFSDPLIGETLALPKILKGFLSGVITVQQKASQASSSGIITWLFFSSIMAALVAIGAVISASEWKLADAFYIVFDTFVILTLNCFCLLGHLSPLQNALGNAGSIGHLISQNFQLAINCFIILVLILLGITKAIVHASKKRRRAE